MIRRIVTLKIDLLELDENLQQREEGLDPSVVAEYAEHPDDLDPVVVFFDGKKHWLADGFHTHEAHLKAGRDSLRCDLRDGEWLDAFVFSLSANDRHGLRRTNADKRKSIRNAVLLNESRRLGWSNREVARKCRVNDKTVAAVMEEIRQEREVQKSAKNTRTVADSPPSVVAPSVPSVARALADAADIREGMARKPADAQEQQRAGLRQIAREGLEAGARGLAVLGLLTDAWRAALDGMIEAVRE